jgi:hypothetical protein
MAMQHRAPSINDLMAALVAELEEGEVPTPLAQEFTLANIWADLSRLAGEELPAAPRAIVGGPVPVTILPIDPERYVYADPAIYFAEQAD